MLVFPTIKHLEALAGMAAVAEALEKARSREVVPVQPRVVRARRRARRYCCRASPATTTE